MAFKEEPLYLRLYRDECYIDVVRAVGYQGTTWRQLAELIEVLAKKYGKARTESACYHLVVFEGQMTATPKPLAEVKLREHVRRLAFMLLGPAPGSAEHVHFQTDKAWVPPWARPKEEPKPNLKIHQEASPEEEAPKKTRRRKGKEG